MSKLKFFANPTTLMAVLMERGLTITKAAKTAGIDFNTFKAAATGKQISIKTASKLRKAFGDDVIALTSAQNLRGLQF